MRLLALLCVFLTLNLNAQDSNLDIKFFGTLGGVYNDNNKYLYTKGPHSKDGSSKKINTYVDSIVGTQATYKFNDNFSLISQGIIKKDDFGDTDPAIDWGYLKYDSNENFIFKLGRIKLPYYKNSNNNNIGYSKLMIREPIEVYGQMPFDIYNGVEFIYSNIINKYFYTIQGSYGQEKFDIPIQTLDQVFKNEIKDLKAINFTFGNDIIEARVSYLHGKITTENQILDQIFNPLSQSLRNKYEMKDKNAEYFGLGLFIDYQNFIFSSEYGKRKVDSFYLGTSGFYTTFGYRFGSLIPYFTYAKVKMDKSTSLKTVTADNFMLNELLKIQNVAQDTKTLGFKYHINQTLDFKFEYQRIRPKGLNGGFNLNPTGNYENSNSNIYSFAIDFVF